MKVIDDFIVAKEVGVVKDPLCLLACVKDSLIIENQGTIKDCDVLLQHQIDHN